MDHSFSHILNFVSGKENAELFRIQQKTLHSMELLKKNCPSSVSLQMIAVSFPEAKHEIPALFDASCELSRSVLDLHDFREKRRLPLISDILSEAAKVATGEYVIFANSDIVFVPGFYNAIQFYLSKGHDALIINRRRIPARFMDEPYEVQVAHAGYDHIGYDCFVFKRSLIGKFFPAEVCIGVPPAGNDLFYNIFTFANDPLLLTRQHLTFHIGMDLEKEWGTEEYLDYNYDKWKKMLKALRPQMNIAKFPGAGLSFFKRHFKWLMNPTFDYPTMFRVDLKQLRVKRKKYPAKELPGAHNAYMEWMLPKVNFPEEKE
ncbi:MAG TPA: hypothetical protein VL651_14180 [Bacteroidia bacterium]|jgi:hypothetical protein|nr:hypothetical protein [Bacteroidia bacterium]